MPERYIIWAPMTEAEEVAQNVRTILSTLPGTVPLSRDLGAAVEVDGPINAVAARLKAAALTSIRRYEPRARVQRVTVERMGDAGLRARVEL